MADVDDFDKYLASLKVKLEQTGHKEPKFLLLTCVDLRYPGLIHERLEGFERPTPTEPGYFHKKYDQVSLAGAALAGVIDFPPHPKPEWAETVIQHVALCIKLHNVSGVVVLEHRDCGAYKEFVILREGAAADEEEQAHQNQVDRLRAKLKPLFPALFVDSFLLDAEPGHDKRFTFLRLQ